MSADTGNGEILTVGIKDSLDLYEKLKIDAGFLKDDWGVYSAYNFFITAWHLHHDWPKSDNSRALSVQKRRSRGARSSEMDLVLGVLRDVCNASKHFELDCAAQNKSKIDDWHPGGATDWWSYYFCEDIPGFIVDGTWYFSLRVVRNIVLSYFDWVFDDSLPVKSFPEEITRTIQYCNVAAREESPPMLYLRDL